MPERICWIDDIDYHESDAALRAIYDQVLSANGQLDNLYRGFSLSAQTILPADNLYKAALHHNSNVLAKVFAELVGTYVAVLARCEYAIAHHGQNFISLSEDETRASQILDDLCSEEISACGSRKEVCALEYVRKLCVHPSQMERADIEALRAIGWNDAEISELVQVVAMFSYFVRVINGVGIELGDEKLGFY